MPTNTFIHNYTKMDRKCVNSELTNTVSYYLSSLLLLMFSLHWHSISCKPACTMCVQRNQLNTWVINHLSKYIHIEIHITGLYPSCLSIPQGSLIWMVFYYSRLMKILFFWWDMQFACHDMFYIHTISCCSKGVGKSCLAARRYLFRHMLQWLLVTCNIWYSYLGGYWTLKIQA